MRFKGKLRYNKFKEVQGGLSPCGKYIFNGYVGESYQKAKTDKICDTYEIRQETLEVSFDGVTFYNLEELSFKLALENMA